MCKVMAHRLIIALNPTVSRRLLFNECGFKRPIDTYDPEFTTTSIIVIIVETLFFIPRLVSRLSGLSKWGWDDTSCVIAYVGLTLL